MAFGAFAPFPLRLGGSTEEGFTATQHARLCADLVAAKRTSPLAIITYERVAGVVTVLSYLGHNGSGLAYAPDPSLSVDLSTGLAAFQWSGSSFIDPYGVSRPFKLRDAKASAHHGTGATKAVCFVNYLDTYQLMVATYNSSGTATDARATVAVW